MSESFANLVSKSSANTSPTLLSHVIARRPGSWELFVRLYTPLIFHWAVQVGAKPIDAADIVQDVFRTLAQKLSSFDAEQEGSTFRGWLRTITRNKARDHFRQQQDRPAAQGGTEALRMIHEIPEDESVSASEAQAEWQIAVREALKLLEAEFSPRDVVIFKQLVMENQSASEVAAAHQMTMGAVYMCKSRILKRLKVVLQQLLGWELS